MEAVRADVLAVPGVEEIHDLHVWTITSGMESASGHIVLKEGAEYGPVLDGVLAVLREKHHIDHATIQCEPREFDETKNAI